MDRMPLSTNVLFEVCLGTVVGFLDPNAVGKSTCMRVICGLITLVSSGCATVLGWQVCLVAEFRTARRRAAVRRRSPVQRSHRLRDLHARYGDDESRAEQG